MTAPRPIQPNRVYLIGRRCAQRAFLLRPDDLTNEIFLYCLAIAAQRFNIEIIAVTSMSNHYHAVVYDPYAALPRFLETFHALTARALNRRRGRTENFWAATQPNINYLVEEGDVIDKTVYALANPVAGNLVDKALNWPGVSSMAWLDGRTVTVKRPRLFFSNRGAMPEVATLRLVTPPQFKGSMSEWAALIRDRVTDSENRAAAQRSVTGGRVLGRKGVLATPPEDQPRTVGEKNSLRPFIAAKSKEARIQALAALREFRRLYARARDAFRAGLRDVVFPVGTFGPVRYFNVSVTVS
jgi:REP element-mobilizing transposase RayT